MYIEPNTNIRLLKNVPLDTTYKHTIYFSSSSAQKDYFVGKTKYNMSDLTYQRVRKGVSRIGRKAEDLYDCNYMMFQNTNFGNKWFYAFIKSVEYVNNEVSEIEFELDVMQTWYFDYDLKECFVEREHSTTDTIGSNLVPERVETGEYVSDDFDGTQKLSDYKFVVAATFNEQLEDAVGGLYSNIYSGLYYNVFNTYEEVNDFIDSATTDGKTDGIVSVFMMPSSFITAKGGSVKSYSIKKNKQQSNIGGYVPRNKKLLTYPYNFLYVTNLDGNSASYNYEDFSDDECTFTLAGDMSCNPSVLLYPNNYKGVLANIDEKLSLSNFPQCGWNTDSFKAWLAYGASSAIGSIAQGVLTGLTVNPYLGIASAGHSLIDTIVQGTQHAIAPNQAHGGTANTTQVALRIKDFAFMHKHIKPQFARIIDDYFDMYGYATHRVKIPNISSRPYWNYVRTVDCVAVGSVPSDDMSKICSIYDKGITFWKNGANVGNYSLDNSV